VHILVTGATGFLGGHLVRALVERGHVVRGLGRNPEACRALAESGVQIVRADLGDALAVQEACDGIDAVYHVGALSAPWGRRADFYRSNVAGTAHVVAGCQRHAVRRLIHISSPSVVFDGRDHENAIEAAPYPRRFLSVYAETKKLAEDIVHEAHASGLDTVIVRPKAIFGPGDTTLLPRLVRAAQEGRLPQIGAGRNRVDLTYVDNVVHALLLALDAPGVAGQTFTITGGESVLLWKLIRDVLLRLDVADRLRRVPYHVAYALAAASELRARLFGGEPVLTRYSVAVLGRTQTYDISAARRTLGYEPVVSVAEGVERSLAALAGEERACLCRS
jgi:2-alkyl-3-oxoalkanoate reductase